MNITKDDIYAECEDLYGFKPENNYDIYQNIDMTIDFFSAIYGEDLHFEPLFKNIKIKLDNILNESNDNAKE